MKIEEKYFVQSIKKSICNEWLLKKHYARRIPSINFSFGLYVKETKICVGVCTYGIPASDNMLLCCGPEYKKHAFELNRLIKNDNLEKNVQSWFVSQTFKLLEKPKIIISYSDPNNGHNGYTYQALNFLYTGKGGSAKEYEYKGRQYTSRHLNKEWMMKKGFTYDDDKTIDQNFERNGGKIIPQKKKLRYIIFLGNKREKRILKKLLKWDVFPYEKGQNEYYDTSYKTTTQFEMF